MPGNSPGWSKRRTSRSPNRRRFQARNTPMSMDIPPPRDGTVLPREPGPFKGVIGDTYRQSTAHWPERVQPAADAPHIVVIMCDDLGFGQLSCFGGPIEAPHLSALAAAGLRYSNFHTTALCSPTRAA